MSDDLIMAALARIEAAQQTQGEQLGAFGTAHTSLRVDLMARMDRLQNSVTALREDIGVNMARAERAHDGIASNRDEVRALGVELAGLFRKVDRIETRLRGLTGDP